MNKIYKIIWSKARNCYIVVSEMAKQNGKCSSSLNKKIIASFLAAGTVLSVTGSAWAGNNTVAVKGDGANNPKVTNEGSDNSVIVGNIKNTTAGQNTVITGNVKDKSTVGDNAVIVGNSAEKATVGDNAVIVGNAKNTKVGTYSVVIGNSTEKASVGENTVIIGVTKKSNVGSNAVVIGNPGRDLHGKSIIVLGDGAQTHTEANGASTNNGIVIGTNALTWLRDGKVANMVAFGKEKSEWNGGIAIGNNAYAGNESLNIGQKNYTGPLGDLEYLDSSNSYNKYSLAAGSTIVGTNSFSANNFTTLAGSFSVISSNYLGNYGGGYSDYGGKQNFGATLVGSLNSIQSAGGFDDTDGFSGLGNSVVGVSNMTKRANVSLVLGAGNAVRNSEIEIDAPKNTSYENVNAMIDELQASLDTNKGGSVMAVGSGNKADSVYLSSLIGSGNSLTNTTAETKAISLADVKDEEKAYSAYNTLQGVDNVGTNIRHTAVIGSDNKIENSKFNIVVGENHALNDAKYNVVIGSQDKDAETKAGTLELEDAVVLGHNADVSVAGKGSVALGAHSVADVKEGVKGYVPEGAKDDNSATWKSTLAAVSVGVKKDADGKQQTRQITNVAAGSAETDAVNVAQLRAATSAAGGTHYYAVSGAEAYKTKEGSNYNNDGARLPDGHEVSHAIAAGPVAAAQGMYSTVMGAYSDVTANTEKTISIGSKKDRVLQGFGATVLGSLNSSKTSEEGPVYASVANGIIGTANSVTDSNGSLVFGAGNEITNSYQDVMFSAQDQSKIDAMLATYDQALANGDRAKMAEVAAKLREMVKISGGQVMAMGGQNTADSAYRSQIIGVGNVLEGTITETKTIGDGEKKYTYNIYDTQYDLLDGFENTVKNSQHVSVIGTGNTVDGSDGDIILGDFHSIKGVVKEEGKKSGNNVIIGSGEGVFNEENLKFEALTSHAEGISDTVMLGHNSEVMDDNGVAVGAGSLVSEEKGVAIGSGSIAGKSGSVALGSGSLASENDGVAIGSSSLANTVADVSGYDPLKGTESTLTSSTWKSTAAAVSVGNDAMKTWYGFTESTLQSNITKYKKQLEALGVDTSLTPAELLHSLDESQLDFVVKNLKPSATSSENEPEEEGKIFVPKPNSSMTRQITNVAAGFNDTDAVNVAQLKASQMHYYSVNDNGAEGLKNYNNDGALGKFAIASGPNTRAEGLLSTVVGANSISEDALTGILPEITTIITNNIKEGRYSSTVINLIGDYFNGTVNSVGGAGSTVIGSMNSIKNGEASVSAAQTLLDTVKTTTSGSKIFGPAMNFVSNTKIFNGVTNTIVGSMNETTDTNAALIYGVGNTVNNSYEDFDELSSDNVRVLGELVSQNDIAGVQNLIKTEYIAKGKGGRAITIGTNNTIDGSTLTQVLGSNNKLTGGRANNIIGSNNILEYGQKNIVIGDGHTLKGSVSGPSYWPTYNYAANNVILGTMDQEKNENKPHQLVNNTIMIGHNADAQKDSSVAIGFGSVVSGANSIAVGTGHKVSGNNSGAFGDPTTINSDNSYSVGNDNTLGNDLETGEKATGVFAFGNNISTITSSSAFLGDNAAYVKAGDITGGLGEVKNATFNGVTYGDFAGATPVGIVSVGSVGSERRIQNVAAGKISATSTDAINGSQLYAAIDGMQFDIVGGDNVEVIKENSNGHTKYTIHSLNAIVEQGTNVTVTPTTPETTDKPIEPAGTNNHTTTYKVDAKDTIYTLSDDGGKTDGKGNTTYTVTLTGAVTGSDDEAPAPTTATIIDTNTTYTIEKEEGTGNVVNKYILKDSNGKSVDVAIEDTDTDTTYTVEKEEGTGNVVNKYTLKDSDGKSVDVAIEDTDTDTTYTVEKEEGTGNVVNKYTLKDSDGKSVDVAIEDTDTNTTNKDIAVTGDAEKTITLTDSDGKKIETTFKDLDTRNTVKAGTNVTVDEKKNDDGSFTYTINAAGGGGLAEISFNGDNKDAQIDNPKALNIEGGATGELTDGNIGVESDGKDTLTIRLAKNINDVDSITVNKNIKVGDNTNIEGDTITTKTVNADTVKAGDTTINNDGLTINEGPSVTKEGIDAGNKTITNVAPGTLDTDAATVGQLKNESGDIRNEISRLDNSTRKGIAGAAALAALHPMDFNPDDKLQFSAGVGNYRGETAAALGMFYRPDESVMFSLGGTFGNSDNLVNAGITFSLDGTRNRITRSRTAMAREIQDLRSLVTQMAARMDRLEGANAETAMFPDVPENHWAYEYVEDLQKRGALKGYPDGLFKGDRAMTRYEFAAMLDRLVRSGVTLDSKIAKEFEPELGRIYVERISGQDNDRNKIERVRVNNSDSKYPEGKNRDVYGSKIQPVVSEKAAGE